MRNNTTSSKIKYLLVTFFIFFTNIAFAARDYAYAHSSSSNGTSWVGLIFFAFLVLVAIFMSAKVVPQGEEWMVERFGKFTKKLSPGLSILIPFVEKVSHKINMREQVLDIQSQSVISKDNAVVEADGIVFFQVIDSAKAVYEVNDLFHAIRNLCLTNIRTVLGSMSLDEQLSNRDKINTLLLHTIDTVTDSWGVKVTRVEIKDLSPPRDLVEAMSRQMKAERQKRADILEAEGQRQSDILRAEGQKQSIILAAEGTKEAAFREAEARERLAKAEANATTSLSEAIAKGDKNALNYFIAQKYVEALQTIGSAENQKLIMLPLDAIGVMGSLAGITEIVKGISKT